MCAWMPNLVIFLSVISAQCLAFECPLPVKVDSEGEHYIKLGDNKFYLGRNEIYEITFPWKDCIIDIDLQPYVEGVGDTHRHCTKMCRASYPELSDNQWDEYMKLRMEEAKERAENAGNYLPPPKF
uniref:Uncharacterized protein n=1 Tax=Schistocephalus solidus TaxID=70667 RepID=A0A0X3Q234_SCHSO